MIKVFIISSIFVVILISSFFILGIISKSGKAPGITKGTLSRCTDKPNCVSSEHKDDSKHYV